MAPNANDMTLAGIGTDVTEIRMQLPSALIIEESLAKTIESTDPPKPDPVPFAELYRKCVSANLIEAEAGSAVNSDVASQAAPSMHL